jgi:hypothetical protein
LAAAVGLRRDGFGSGTIGYTVDDQERETTADLVVGAGRIALLGAASLARQVASTAPVIGHPADCVEWQTAE